MAAAAALPIMGGIVGAIGAKQQGDAQASAANFNYQTNMVNANSALEQGAEQERQQRVYAAKQIGQARADYGASGVSGGSGSATDVLQESARNAEMDSLNIKYNSQMKAWGYQRGAQLDSMQSAAATNAGNWGAMTSIFGGASSAARYM